MYETDIVTTALKENIDIFPHFFLVSSITIYSSSFSNYLKLANITPVHKKDSRNDKRNYRPVSVISYVLQVFENIWNQKISVHFENIFSKQQTAFFPPRFQCTTLSFSYA